MDFEKMWEQVMLQKSGQMLEEVYRKMLASVKESGMAIANEMFPLASSIEIEEVVENAWKAALVKERLKQPIKTMSREEFFALAEREEGNPRERSLSFPMTKEEFCSLTDEEVERLERETSVHYEEYSREGFVERAEQSQLSKYGYSVSKQSALSRKQRQALLEHLIKTKIVSKGYVVSYLEHNIKINGKKEANYSAAIEWRADLDFVQRNT